MAKYDFMGDAIAVAQVNTITVGGTPANGQVYSVTINGKTVSYTANGGDTNNTIATALEAALEASAAPEFVKVDWTVNAAVVTGTAVTAGVPFTNTSAATGTGTLVTATATANDGPNTWSAANFRNIATGARGVLPGGAADDEVYIQDKSVSILYGLDQSGIANPLVVLHVSQTYTGTIGRPRTNIDDTAKPYDEYLPTYLKIKCSAARIGYGVGTGSGRLKIDFGGTNCKIKIYGSGSQVDDYPPIHLRSTATINVLEVLGGHVGLALDEGQTSRFDEIYVSKTGQLLIGAGVTVVGLNAGDNAKITMNWRQLELSVIYITGQAQVTLNGGVSSDGATARIMDHIFIRSRGVLLLNCEAGTTTNLFIGASATLDARGGPSKMTASVVNVFTVTNLATAQAGNQENGKTKIWDPGKRVAWTAGLQLDGMMSGFELDLGTPVKLVSGGGSLS